MTERIPDGEPMIYGKDFELGEQYPYQEVKVEEGDRVGYETPGGELVVGTVTDRTEHTDGSETITWDTLTVVQMWENPMIRDPITAAELNARMRAFAVHIRPTVDQLEQAFRKISEQARTLAPLMEQARPSHTPPFWAEQPNKQRRTKYGPTRRAK